MATAEGLIEKRRGDRLFFSGMGLFVLALALAGFARTYYLARWVPQPDRVPEVGLLLHLHAAAFTLWMLLGAVQPFLIAVGRPSLHRRLGYGGAALALLVWVLGNVVALDAIISGYRGLGDPYAFYAITFFSIQAFGLIVLIGIWRRNDAETHKRLMLLSSAAILEAAVGRLPLHMVAQAAPLSFYLGADLVIVAGAAYDLATRGRLHPVWIWGGGGLILSQVLRVAIMDTAPWLAFTHFMSELWTSGFS